MDGLAAVQRALERVAIHDVAARELIPVAEDPARFLRVAHQRPHDQAAPAQRRGNGRAEHARRPDHQDSFDHLHVSSLGDRVCRLMA